MKFSIISAALALGVSFVAAAPVPQDVTYVTTTVQPDLVWVTETVYVTRTRGDADATAAATAGVTTMVIPVVTTSASFTSLVPSITVVDVPAATTVDAPSSSSVEETSLAIETTAAVQSPVEAAIVATPTAVAVESSSSEVAQPTTTAAASTTEAVVTTEAAPSTTETPAATTEVVSSTSEAAAAASSSSSTSGSISGEGTFYAPGLGACGQTSSSADAVVAISHSLFDSASTSANPNENPMCGKMITAFYEGKSVSVQVVDRCEGCAEGDLDFSPSAFGELAEESAGRIGITWEWQ